MQPERLFIHHHSVLGRMLQWTAGETRSGLGIAAIGPKKRDFPPLGDKSVPRNNETNKRERGRGINEAQRTRGGETKRGTQALFGMQGHGLVAAAAVDEVPATESLHLTHMSTFP